MPTAKPATHVVVDWNRDVFCCQQSGFLYLEKYMNRIKSIHTSPAVGLRAAGSALLLVGLLALAPAASANEANLTRFGPEIYEREQGRPTSDLGRAARVSASR